MIRTLLENPFENTAWPCVNLELVLILTQNKERILVGTRTAILSQLKKYATPPEDYSSDEIAADSSSSDSFYEVICDKIHDISSAIIESTVSNPSTARQKQKLKKDMPDLLNAPILICDRSYKPGHFLLDFQYDADKWQEIITLLDGLIAKKTFTPRNKVLNTAKTLLLEKWNTHDPVCQYVSLRIWQSYLKKSSTFVSDAKMLISAFCQAPPTQALQTMGDEIPLHDPILRLPRKLDHTEEQIKIWYPSDVPVECAVMENSVIPLKLYYRRKLNEWGIKFCVCLVCGEVFLAKTRKQITCSPQCADIRVKKNKANYDSWARQNDFELLYKRSYQRWYNRIKKARELPDFPPDRLEKLEAAFDQFKQESHHQKILARATEDPIKSFKTWSNEQERTLREIMGEYEDRICRKKMKRR